MWGFFYYEFCLKKRVSPKKTSEKVRFPVAKKGNCFEVGFREKGMK
jgi:hypothetical protein